MSTPSVRMLNNLSRTFSYKLPPLPYLLKNVFIGRILPERKNSRGSPHSKNNLVQKYNVAKQAVEGNQPTSLAYA